MQFARYREQDSDLMALAARMALANNVLTRKEEILYDTGNLRRRMDEFRKQMKSK